jgi:flagellar biosynthetic protein FlhB
VGLFGQGGDRTERATPRRRNEARSKGNVARSPQLAPAAVFLGVFVVLGKFGSSLMQNLSVTLRNGLSHASVTELSESTLQKLVLSYCSQVSWSLFLIAGSVLVLSVSANALQGGLVLSGGRVGLHLENLNPAAGLKRLMPGNSLGELIKSLLTIALLAWLSWSSYTDAKLELPRYVLMSPLDSSEKIAAIIYRLAIRSGMLLLVIGFADFLWRRHQFEKSIRMTKQEIKDESRSSEGNPEIRSRIRKRQREIALRSMLADVKKADVVITNPTHYAIALRYVPQKQAAPVVVAKGKGYVALKIREIATANHVPIVENKPLAQTLFKALDVGEQIPADLFKAIAEVLAYVYRIKQRHMEPRRQGG